MAPPQYIHQARRSQSHCGFKFISSARNKLISNFLQTDHWRDLCGLTRYRRQLRGDIEERHSSKTIGIHVGTEVSRRRHRLTRVQKERRPLVILSRSIVGRRSSARETACQITFCRFPARSKFKAHLGCR